jgi:hypothetical protein
MRRSATLAILFLAIALLASSAWAADEQDFLQVRGTPGYWRLVQDQEGVWWFQSPTGKLEFLNTVTTVVPYQKGRRVLGPHYVSRDWVGQVTGTLREGDVDAWAVRTLARVRAAGFKGLGAWCHPVFHEGHLNPDTPITRDLNLWQWTVGPAKRLYHPGFAVAVEDAVRDQVTPLQTSKTLVGYFTDNELDWSDDTAGPAAYFDGLAPSDPNRRKVVEAMQRVWPTIDAFNADWKTTLGTWDDLDAWTYLPHPEGAYEKLYLDFVEQLSRDYFELTSRLVRQYAPNHLVLGVRYKGYIIPEVVRGQAGQTDAVSINYYVGDARLDRQLFESLHRDSGGQPVMIGEYSFHALDGRSGNRNTFGFVAQVPDQQARADGYKLMTERLAAVPYIVGADWFQWNDEPPSGRTSDGEDVNFGVVDVDDHEYEGLVEAVRATTPGLNDLHAKSGGNILSPWRPDYVRQTPSGMLAHLPKTPRIDGSLREWRKLGERFQLAIRRNVTVGADRVGKAEPKVFAGWSEEGLYVAVEVPDADVQAARADGPWWTQDAVEIFVSTARDADATRRGYTANDHQFFFVPNPFPQAGNSGTWGQWSRDGDLLNGTHQIPATGLVDAARVLPGRYVTELFIPTDRLHGFDPSAGSAIRFNVNVRDYQTATEFYWSAPKEAGSQFRPVTWGMLELAAPGEGTGVIEAPVETADIDTTPVTYGN